MNIGDKVVVTNTYAEYEEVYIGEVGVIVGVHRFDTGDVYDISLEGGGRKEFYEEELELHAPAAPVDYAETTDKPVIDEDLAHLSDGDQDLYHEIVLGLSQAIAHKAKQMGSDKPRLMGEHVALGCETPSVDMPEEDDSDAEIYKELRGHRQSEVFGILQGGLTHEQALAARDRALAKKRKDDLDNARKALEEAQKRYDEVAEKGAKVTFDGKAIAEATIRFGEIPGHPHGITLNAGDEEWDNMEDVGREVIYDAYNPDVVKAPAHYVNSKIEPIDYMADKLPAYTDGHTAFCIGNVIKYVSRAPHKGTFLQDLKKAAQYLEFAIEHEEKKQG